MRPWYDVVEPREEVRKGRSFNPDEFAIHLEQIVTGNAPKDYREPEQFFSRNFFTRALSDHCGMVLRRLSGHTDNTAPVLTLVTQFGGGKTHTLAALYHLAKSGPTASAFDGVAGLLTQAGLRAVPQAQVAVFVGNAWDPQQGKETPWIDIARQLAGDKGVRILGPAAMTAPPGTETLGKLFAAAGGSVLILLDEVLNLLNRHRDLAEPFYAFIQNLTGAMTGTTHGAAVISLPRSQVEMTPWDMDWQAKITKVVKRVATDLIANDEREISEVIRRRLFEDLGSERTRKSVAKEYANWCFERRDKLPPEWTTVDTTATERQARELLQERFEACYPFHPATLSVFQRKWAALPQYQQTRGTLAMLAQWVSRAHQEQHKDAQNEPLLTIGLAPLHIPEFRSVVLGQLGEPGLNAAIDADIAGDLSHARALDADCDGALESIHRRVGTAIMFESTGGQRDKIAHLPELRFALCKPGLDTTSIDIAASTLEERAFFIRRVGSDGYQIRHQPTLKKVVADRRASLDPESDVIPRVRTLVQQQFEELKRLPTVPFPVDSTAVSDTPKLTLVIMDPEVPWDESPELREQIVEWTQRRGSSPRLYPGSLVWCFRKPGRELRDRVEAWLAWKRVEREVSEGILGEEFDRGERTEIQSKVKDAEEDARDEVWASYRYVMLADSQEADGLRRQPIDLGAGHASAGQTLSGRVLTALVSEGLLNVETVGAGYLDRHWPPAFAESGAWPIVGLRKSFLDGSLTRLLDPDVILRKKILEFVEKGDFGLASGETGDGGFQRVWFREAVGPEEVSFDNGVFLLTKARAEGLSSSATTMVGPEGPDFVLQTQSVPKTEPRVEPPAEEERTPEVVTLRLSGRIPSEAWNRFGQKVVTKLRSSGDLAAEVSLTLTVPQEAASPLEADLKDALTDLGIVDQVRVERR